MGQIIDPGDAPSLEQPLATLAAKAGVSASYTQTRPNNVTAYAANDVLGGILPSDATLGGPALMDFFFPQLAPLFSVPGTTVEFLITSTEFERDVTALISGETSYNLWCYNTPPTSALLDNAAFDIPAGDRVSLVGKVNLGTPVDEGSTLYIRADGINQQVTLKSPHLYAYVATVGAYTPAASTVLKTTVHGVAL